LELLAKRPYFFSKMDSFASSQDSGSPADDWHPTARWQALRLRDALLRRLRAFFHARDFIEVDTPLLSADVVVDRHLEPFAVDLACGSSSRRLWLQTSPEFAMKRLMAAGGEAIFQVTHAFRQEEQGPLHNPEFTMVEWYRRGDGLEEGMRLLGELAEVLLGRGEAETMTSRAAFERYAGIDPHQVEVANLAAVARERSIAVPESLADDDRDAWLDLLLVELVEPHLGRPRPAIVYDYPASQAALACVRPGPPAVAERFELYVDGIELANGYHELLDAAVLRERNRENNRQRLAHGRGALPEESRLLAAMEAGLPKCAGVAMGFDRMVMLAAGAPRISEVLAFPIDRA
jgi:elongation factor P--(R)-beta-lysine ligase